MYLISKALHYGMESNAQFFKKKTLCDIRCIDIVHPFQGKGEKIMSTYSKGHEG
jgi:hypothetical protein